MRFSSTVVCLLVAVFVVASAGCYSTGVWNSQDWGTSSFNPSTWRMGLKQPPTSLAMAPPAKPSLSSTPTYPNTAEAGSSTLSASTTPPKVEYPTTAASFNSPGSETKNPLMAPQQGRYGENDAFAASPTAQRDLNPSIPPRQNVYGSGSTLATNSVGGFNNPVYNSPANASSLSQSPYRSTAPAIPEANGSLAPYASAPSPTCYADPYSSPAATAYSAAAKQDTNTDSRYPINVASANSSAAAAVNSHDPGDRYYDGQPSGEAAPAASYDSAALPKVVSGYPSTSSAAGSTGPSAGAISNAGGPAAGAAYPTATAGVNGVNVAAPYNADRSAGSVPPSSGYPISSPAAVMPPAAAYQPAGNGYQPGANGYQPAANQYVPGNTGYQPGTNGYQIPAARSTAPVQSAQQVDNNFGYYGPTGNVPQMQPLAPSSDAAAPPFRPGSTGKVDDYPWTPDSASDVPMTAYPDTQATPPPVRTSINTSNVMPVGFDQDTTSLRR